MFAVIKILSRLLPHLRSNTEPRHSQKCCFQLQHLTFFTDQTPTTALQIQTFPIQVSVSYSSSYTTANNCLFPQTQLDSHPASCLTCTKYPQIHMQLLVNELANGQWSAPDYLQMLLSGWCARLRATTTVFLAEHHLGGNVILQNYHTHWFSYSIFTIQMLLDAQMLQNEREEMILINLNMTSFLPCSNLISLCFPKRLTESP